MRRLAWNAVTVLAAAVLAGCQPATPTPPSSTTPVQSPTSVPTPTYLCTPEAGGDEAPCSEIEYEEMKAKDALYAEAEAVFREYFAENIRISRAGGVTQPTETILRTTTGSVLKSLMEVFRDMETRGVRAVGSDPVLLVERAPGLAREGSAVALEVCTDATGWSFYSGDEFVSSGRMANERVYFAKAEESLKMVYIEGKWVESCAPD